MSLKRILYLLLVLIIAGSSALVGAAVGGFAVYQVTRAQSAPVSSAPLQVAGNGEATTLVLNATDIQTGITQAAQRVGPAVVTVVGVIPGARTYFGQLSDQTVSGSGFFISDQGYVLTNYHVVEDVSEVWVVLADGSQQPARIVGGDPYSDIAVLKTDGPVPAVATLGNSDLLNPGETVIAIGSPLGDFRNTVTVGVISATNRSLDTGKGYAIEGLIQTDAAINQGNSGGPLVNLAGEVVAINTLIVRGNGSGTVAEGLGFAIPVNNALAVVQQILEQGYFARPYLGISFQPITPTIAHVYRLPAEYGAYVTRVTRGSPADQAGIRQGDIIVSIGGVTLDKDHPYINTLFAHQPGEKVTVGLLRAGQSLEVEVTLGATAGS